MGRNEGTTGCCAPGEVRLSYAESLELGSRRRTRVIRFSAAASVALSLSGVMITIGPGWVSGSVVGDRLLWAAALFATPLVLGYAREFLVMRRLSWHLLVVAGLIGVAVLGYPIVPAAAAAVVLTMRAVRPVKSQACEQDCTLECCSHRSVAVVGLARRAG